MKNESKIFTIYIHLKTYHYLNEYIYMKNESKFFTIFQGVTMTIDEALANDDWIIAMEKELHQFTRNNVWTLVPKLENESIIGTRWVFRNKLDEQGKVVRNKARLVAQGYNQQKGIDFTKTHVPIARLKAIRIILAFALYFFKWMLKVIC